MIVLVGAAMTAHFKRKQRDSNSDYWSPDWSPGIFIASMFWIIGIAFLSWHYLTTKMLDGVTVKVCILCGTKNDNDSSHCKHCGNLMGAELKE